jgi:beta-glucosidase
MLNRSFYFAASILTLFIALTMSLFAQESAGPVPRTTAIDQRVDAMLAKMTLEQKLELIGGEEDMFIRAVPAAGFPRLKMSDGPDGVRTWGPDTAYAGGIALAATWTPTWLNAWVFRSRRTRARAVFTSFSARA